MLGSDRQRLRELPFTGCGPQGSALAESLAVPVVPGQPWAKGQMWELCELQRTAAGSPTPLLTTPHPAPGLFCLDIGAHFRQPELGRWFPRKKAGEEWASLVSPGGWGQVYARLVHQGSPPDRPSGRQTSPWEWGAAVPAGKAHTRVQIMPR